MKKKALLLISIFVFWMLYFQTARILFYIYHFKQLKWVLKSDVLLSSIYGAWMDASMVAYICILPCTLLLYSVFSTRWIEKIYHWYAFFLMGVFSFLIAIDMELFTAWGFRLDASLLPYLASPKEAIASSLSSPWWLLSFFAIMIFFIFYFLHLKWILPLTKVQLSSLWHIVPILLMGASLAIPIRGGFQLSPINESFVYFSKSNIINQASNNCIWNFAHSVVEKNYKQENQFQFYDKQTLDSIFQTITAERKANFKKIIRTDCPNIVMIIWESGSSKILDDFEGKEITPQLKKISKEGVYFSQCYAAGNRTEKGLAAILSGYPNLPEHSIVMNPVKSAQLPSLIAELSTHGYFSTFLYGGEIEFANIKSFLISSQVDKIVSRNDFPDHQHGSKWGAHDQYTFKKLLELCNLTKKPFFNMLLTLSSHEPFDIPSTPLLKPTDRDRLYLNSIHYADSCLGDFVRQAKQQTWWQNTLLVIVADHGTYLPGHGLMEHAFNDYRIPLVLTGGAITDTFMLNHTISQLDIPNIILSQLGIDDSKFIFGSNTLMRPTYPWAFYSFNNGFAALSDSMHYLHDNVGNIPLKNPHHASQTHIDKGKAFLQKAYQDYLLK